MIQITPQMRVVVAIEPADFRKGIDGLARLCKEVLHHDPFRGWLFVFRNRKATALKILVYDGQGAPEVSGQPHKKASPEHLVDNVARTVVVWSATVPRGYVDEVRDSSARQLPRECETLAMLCSLGSLARQSLRMITKGTG